MIQCQHGHIPFGGPCPKCQKENAERLANHARPMESTDKVKCDDFEFGDPIVQIALHQSSVKRMDDTVQELSRNVADLTSVARALLAIGSRLTEPKALDVEFPEVKRGPVTEEELRGAMDAGSMLPWEEENVRKSIEHFARSRGVL